MPGDRRQIAAAGHTDSARGIDVFTVKVEVDPSQAEVEIKPGMTAEVHIAIGDYADLVKLPRRRSSRRTARAASTLVKDEDGKKVKSKTEVTIGHRTDREVEIKSGVAGGRSVLRAGDVKDMKAEIN